MDSTDSTTSTITEIANDIRRDGYSSNETRNTFCQAAADELLNCNAVKANWYIRRNLDFFYKAAQESESEDSRKVFQDRSNELRNYLLVITKILKNDLRRWLVSEIERLQGFSPEEIRKQGYLPEYERALQSFDEDDDLPTLQLLRSAIMKAAREFSSPSVRGDWKRSQELKDEMNKYIAYAVSLGIVLDVPLWCGHQYTYYLGEV